MSDYYDNNTTTADESPPLFTSEDDSSFQAPIDDLPHHPEMPDGVPGTTTAVGGGTDFLRDIYLWRRKNLSSIILLVATAVWVLLDIYKFNFITVLSWLAMFVISSIFFWANIHRLLKKEAPDMSGMEMSEESATKVASTVREWAEKGERWMFRVGAEGEWFEFAAVVGALYLLSLVAPYFDFLTFLYIGTVTGLSLPIIYTKYEKKIKEFGQRLRIQSERSYSLIRDKLSKLGHKIVGEEKTKKTE